MGALLSYVPTDWLTLTAGPVVGRDVADDNNSGMSVMGQITVTPMKDLTTTLNVITGPEQAGNDDNRRTVLDFIVAYTGITNVTLALNVDYGWEGNEALLTALGTRSDTDARWWGVAAYAAYDWTPRLRTAVRGEYFSDPEGVRTAATAQYRIWKGLMARLEYRHDEEPDSKVFKIRAPGRVPTGRSQDTITLALGYLFF